jgi:hypothetical protein
MATTKSTVLGIRLDHDRRAWVEGEAARRGLSVRGLFEGMIDGARLGEAMPAEKATAGSGFAEPGALGGQHPVEETGEALHAGDTSTSESDGGVYTPRPTPLRAPSNSSPWTNFGSVATVPSGLIRGAFSLTTGLIESSSRCAGKRLRNCALTRFIVAGAGVNTSEPDGRGSEN